MQSSGRSTDGHTPAFMPHTLQLPHQATRLMPSSSTRVAYPTPPLIPAAGGCGAGVGSLPRRRCRAPPISRSEIPAPSRPCCPLERWKECSQLWRTVLYDFQSTSPTSPHSTPIVHIYNNCIPRTGECNRCLTSLCNVCGGHACGQPGRAHLARAAAYRLTMLFPAPSSLCPPIIGRRAASPASLAMGPVCCRA